MEKKTAEKSDVAQREETVLAFWNEHHIFDKTLKKDAPKGDFVFYDGPPFATGLPHYGHILAGTIKDAIPRFRTMQGYHVERKWGWDCHGLPLENIIEKRLGLATKRDIEALGVKKFNEAAREAVLEYADDWKRIIPRMGRFVDMEHDYKTMDPSYTETVWWVFSELNRKGLVYEGFKSMHLCPRCGTTLSNFEVNQGYKDIKDIAVTVKMPLALEPETSVLIWTTTPWTLPGNMAVAVHRDIEYVKVRCTLEGKNEIVVLAKERLVQLGTDTYEILASFKGSELIGKKYIPPFDTFKNIDIKNKENAWKIYHADYVEIGEEGTGAVHLAPAYGEDDLVLAQTNNIPIVHHVDEDGRFKDFVTHFAGQLVKPKDDEGADVSHLDSDIEVVKRLKDAGRLFRKENITHSYPHCWRCDTPLINYATTSWFVRVTDLRDKLVKENSMVKWVPDHVGTNRFGKWLEGARDWAISRQRYWGAPLPIWKNQKTGEHMVLGSLEELKKYVPKSGNRYLLMRHGESEFNTRSVLNCMNGTKNGLTDTGKKQVTEAIRKLQGEKVDIVYHSPLQRTTETAQLVKEALGLADGQVFADERLLEMQFGEFEARTVDEYHAYFGHGYNRLVMTPKGGESWTDVKRRVGAFLYEINTKHTDKNILIVSHNGVLQMIQAAAYGTSHETLGDIIENDTYDVKNAEVRKLSFTPVPHNDNYELDYHRPYIDEIELVGEDGSKLTRVQGVFDCWFESGSMPYGEKHYPFENTDTFEPKKSKGYPANFIAEGIDQTRGWFYSLIVLGTALFGKSPYENVIVNGTILAEDGQKMSKRLQNYPDPMELADRVGVDALRYYLLSSPVVRSEDLSLSEKEVLEQQRKNIGRLHNVLAMYEMYADAKVKPSETSKHVLDRWIIARLHETTAQITDGYEGYELDKATRPIESFIDDLSVWYLRRSRERLKNEDDAKDKEHALSTLRHVLRALALLMAPVMPFYAEYLWQRVREESDAESVHLADWPKAGKIDAEALQAMHLTRDVVTKALEARMKENIKVRQPLRTLFVGHELHTEGEPYHALIRDEVNVKELKTDISLGESIRLDTVITPELKMEGDAREFIRQVQDMRKKAGLEPKDKVTLSVQTSAGGEEVLRAFEETIKKVTGSANIEYTCAAGEEILAGEHSYTVALTKL